MLSARQDLDATGTFDFPGGQINSATINAPVAGVLIISANVFVRNNHTAAQEPELHLRVDGTSVSPSNWTARIGLAPTVAGTLAATASHAVAAGNHTVTQLIQNAPSALFYNAQELSVTFIPGSHAGITGPAGAPERPSGSIAGN